MTCFRRYIFYDKPKTKVLFDFEEHAKDEKSATLPETNIAAL